MAVLRYWIMFPRGGRDDGSLVYARRAKTRSELEKEQQAYYEKNGEWGYYESIQKIEMHYTDTFDLLRRCMEGTRHEEDVARDKVVLGRAS